MTPREQLIHSFKWEMVAVVQAEIIENILNGRLKNVRNFRGLHDQMDANMLASNVVERRLPSSGVTQAFTEVVLHPVFDEVDRWIKSGAPHVAVRAAREEGERRHAVILVVDNAKYELVKEARDGKLDAYRLKSLASHAENDQAFFERYAEGACSFEGPDDVADVLAPAYEELDRWVQEGGLLSALISS